MKLGAYSFSFWSFGFEYQTMAMEDKPICFCKIILTPKNVQDYCGIKEAKSSNISYHVIIKWWEELDSNQ